MHSLLMRPRSERGSNWLAHSLSAGRVCQRPEFRAMPCRPSRYTWNVPSTTIPEKLRKQLAALPAKPGVYIMRNARGEVIYVGKAARLKDRVRSYFGSPAAMEPKTRALREHIEDF